MGLLGWIFVAGLAAPALWLARERQRRRRRIRRLRDVLLQVNATGERFDPGTLDDIPPPAARYLRHALAPDALLARTADLHVVGRLRVGSKGDWVPFEGRERISAERGFLWQGRLAALRRLWVEGAEWLVGDDAGAEYAAAGWLPVVNEHHESLARSSAGRLLTDLVWLPGALTPQRGARWATGDADKAVVTPAGSATPLSVDVAEDGRLREVSLVRRRIADDGRVSVCPFGLVIEAEERFGDTVVPVRVTAVWGLGTDDHEECFRAEVNDVRWL